MGLEKTYKEGTPIKGRRAKEIKENSLAIIRRRACNILGNP